MTTRSPRRAWSVVTAVRAALVTDFGLTPRAGAAAPGRPVPGDGSSGVGVGTARSAHDGAPLLAADRLPTGGRIG
ncbi:hypothetical protein [Streptomyces diastaticus]|uniref:hypothetical protein n=1 Tax=Streptomyces diastaticus TaxID=1956 RepID=UPI0035E201E8